MLSTKMKEAEEKTIIIQAKSVKDVEDMAYCMCTEMLRPGTNAMNLLPLAHLYQMKAVLYLCSERIINELVLDNFVETFNILDKFNVKSVFYRLSEFAKANKDLLEKRD